MISSGGRLRSTGRTVGMMQKEHLSRQPSCTFTKARWWSSKRLMPAGRTVIHFRFRGAPEKLRCFWLVLPEADLCLSDPGFGVDLTVRSDPK